MSPQPFDTGAARKASGATDPGSASQQAATTLVANSTYANPCQAGAT
jgi:hypothetical protein